jgi:hypothetical protein
MASLTGVDRIVADRMWRDPPTRTAFERETGLTDHRSGDYHVQFREWASARLRYDDFKKDVERLILVHSTDGKDTPAFKLAEYLASNLKIFDSIVERNNVVHAPERNYGNNPQEADQATG